MAQPTPPLRVCVASTNPVKVNSAKAGFEDCFPATSIAVIEKGVPSGVSDQPMSDHETKQGAINRAKGAKAAEAGCDYYVGMEGGIELDSEGKMWCFAWMIVVAGNTDKIGAAKTSTFLLPEKITELVKSGVELGHADDQVFGRVNSKHQGGTVGQLTHGLITRTDYYRHAMIQALIPFTNPDLSF